MNQFEMKQRAYQSNLKNRALQVLLYLIDRANKEQTCFPAVPTIGRELHISISTVKRAMRELVEAGYVDHSEEEKQQVTRLVIAQYLTEVRDAGVDTLILGCTHYPLLKTMIGEFMGQSVTLVDPAKTAAHHLERMLSERGLRAAQENEGQAHFYVSDVPDSFVQTADLFLGEYKGGPVEQIAIDKY